MNKADQSRLATLREALAATQAEVVQLRGDLIEALGDKMCNSGSGPSQEQAAAWEALRLRKIAQQEKQIRLIAEITSRYLKRVQVRAGEFGDAHSATAHDTGPGLPRGDA